MASVGVKGLTAGVPRNISSSETIYDQVVCSNLLVRIQLQWQRYNRMAAVNGKWAASKGLQWVTSISDLAFAEPFSEVKFGLSAELSQKVK